MSISAQSAEQIVKLLKQKVIAGQIDKDTANHLAVLALQEVQIADDVAEGADTTSPEDEEELVDEAPVEEDATPAPAIDPSAQILSLVGQFDQGTSSLWEGIKAKIEDVLKGVQGEAFPLGVFSSRAKTGEKGNNTQISIEKGKRDNSVGLTFTFKRDWEMSNVTPPATVAAAAPVEKEEEPACHLGLRKELLALAQDVSDIADSELVWKRSRLPEGTIAYLSSEATKVNDVRVCAAMGSLPEGLERDAWRRWSIAAQVYMLGGSDYAEGKTFADITKEIKE
jgi:hypothetical protein